MLVQISSKLPSFMIGTENRQTVCNCYFNMDENCTLLSSIQPNVSNFRRMMSTSGDSLELLPTKFISSISVFFLLLAVTGLIWVLFSNKNMKNANVRQIKKLLAGDHSETFDPKYTKSHGIVDNKVAQHVKLDRRSQIEEWRNFSKQLGRRLQRSSSQEFTKISDSNYSMELQIQEVLLATLSSQASYTASSSTQARRILDVDSRPVKIDNDVDDASQIFCEICMEAKESWEMFKNDSCHHSFCYECTSKHIVAKIQDNLKVISCPGADCKATLDFNICRLMIPKDVLAKWDEFLCQSLIPNSQKLFCPFRDCSVMLIHDSGEVIKEIKCPVCRRSFCAECHVPWHSEFTCKEFQKLNAEKVGTDDGLFKLLAKKKRWQKCPSCKMHVEKVQGCIHISCRCRYEFCYRCGSKWTGSHVCKKS